MSGERPKAAVLHNAPVLPPGHPDSASESDVVDVARAVASILDAAGFEAETFAVGPPVSSLAAYLEGGATPESRPSVAFNLIEGFGGLGAGATYATGVLELSGVPYTGSSVESLAFCQEKSRAKALLRGFGLPTTPSLVILPGDRVASWPWDGPALVKPDAEDGSLGIDQSSVVLDISSAQDRVRRIHDAYGGAALIEPYLPGPEFNVGVIALPEPLALPIAEVLFTPAPGGWPILTYEAKWAPGSAEDLASQVRCPAVIELELADRLGRLAVAAFAATRCRDYARVDFRLDGRGEPMILEVNPNPDIGPTAGWARALRSSGREYAATIVDIARQALARGSNRGH